MSYCRMGPDSDVYVIATGRATWQCFSGPDHFYQATTRRSMVEHLMEHRFKKDKVPQRALDRLYREMEQYE